MCDCIKTTNEMLKAHNAELVATIFGNPPRVSIETQKADPKKRGKPPRLIATYCPLCGEKYAVDRSVEMTPVL